MDEVKNELDQMIKDVVKSVGAENVTQLLASFKQKTHEAKYFGKCENVYEAEKHMVGCPECLNNMPPVEVFWKLTHHTKEMPCETPTHSKDRHLVN